MSGIQSVLTPASTLRRGLGLTLFAALALAWYVSRPASAAAPQLQFEPCHLKGRSEPALCTTFTVFEDRTARQGREIPLRVALVPALRRRPLPEPLFLLAGGPGQAATAMAPLIDVALSDVHKNRDIVLVDLRGTGASAPLECNPWGDRLPITTPPLAEIQKTLGACLQQLHADVRLYTSEIAMDDLDDVRQALGYERIHMLGGSYGTREALVYLRRHQEHVATVVLDAPAPFENRLPLDYARDGQAALDLLFTDCAAEPACAAAFPHLDQEFQAVLDRLDRDPAEIEMPHPQTGEPLKLTLTRADFTAHVRNLLYVPSFSSFLPYLIHQAALGHFEPLIALVPQSMSWSLDTMSLGRTFSVLCTQDVSRIDESEIPAATAGTFIGREAVDEWMKICSAWPRGTMPQDTATTPFEAPALILTGPHDPATPPRWGEAMAKLFTNAQQIIVPAAAHGTMHLGCVPRLIAQFIDEAGSNGLETSCVESIPWPPFVVAAFGPEP